MPSGPIIITTQQLPEMFTQALGQLGETALLDPERPAETARVLLSSSVDDISADLIARLPDSLGLIANLGVGIDKIDLEAARARGIRVSNTPVVGEDTADLTWALLLAACRRVSAGERLVQGGDWFAGAADPGQRVHGKTLGIIGFGDIGQAVARRARGFDMQVLYHGPRSKPEAEALEARYIEDLEQLLAEADIVSLNCPLTPDTHHLLNAERLAQMKPGAVLVNTGRGALVDEAALVAALDKGQLGAAGLDVYEFEPKVHPGLLHRDNVTLLPHIGSSTGECRMDMALCVFDNIKRWLESGELKSPVE